MNDCLRGRVLLEGPDYILPSPKVGAGRPAPDEPGNSSVAATMRPMTATTVAVAKISPIGGVDAQAVPADQRVEALQRCVAVTHGRVSCLGYPASERTWWNG